MAESSNQSFIPRNTPRKKTQRSSVRRIYVFAYLSYTVFIATLIAAGGVFIYKYSVESSLVAEQQRLISVQDEFNESDINFIGTYEEQLRTAELRLRNQMQVSRFLTSLQEVVVADAYFDTLTYERVSTAPATVGFSILASDFDTLLFQREQLRTNPVTDSAVTTGVSLSQNTDEETGANTEEISLNVSLSLSPDDVTVSQENGNQVNAVQGDSNDQAPSTTTNSTSTE